MLKEQSRLSLNMSDKNNLRIVSLVPSLTELLIDLGLKDQLVGRTRFCIHPEDQVQDIPIMGGTKNPNIQRILDAEPDLIIANDEENRKEDVEALMKKVPVYVTHINTIVEALHEIENLGDRLNVQKTAQNLVSEIQYLLSESEATSPINTAYFIWREPWMVAANHTYIHDVLRHYQLTNCFSDYSRYPEIELQQLKEASPELVLLSSEPYPFKEKHISEIKEYVPNAHIELINGEWFSWYGSGMLKGFKELNAWRRKIKI